MRSAPQAAPAPASRATGELVHDERTYRFLTPVFGGGVHVEKQHKHADPRTPVRVPSIRGQLRFWWRACNPRGCKTTEALFAAESTIFGSTSQPSPLSIAVVSPPQARRAFPILKDKFGVVDGMSGIAYGAFPLRDTDNGTDHGVLHEHAGDWTISLSYPESVQSDVEAALWAWSHFGGLGGRTRRGFGAVTEVKRRRGALATIPDGWRSHVAGLAVSWPHLPAFDARRVQVTPGTWKRGVDAQDFLLGVLRRLRQGEAGRNTKPEQKQGGHPGRSYWPEPDTIRKLTGSAAPAHRAALTRVRAFPRAAFGLPIIFHFKDDKAGDPSETRLVPRVGDKPKGRLASALILRPHVDASGAIEALAVVLAHPAPDGLVLLGKRDHPVTKWTLTEEEARTLGVEGRRSPLVKEGHVFPDPIDRFLEEIR